jgi:predicted ATP-dependent serine protease
MSDSPKHVSLVDHTDEVEVLKDIKVPEKFFNRIRMDVQVLDEIFGGQEMPGILAGTSILFTGMPGAGKSTAALQFGDLIQRNAGRNILYNIGEENKFMIKMRADRLGVDGNFGISMFEDVNDLIQFCRDSGVEVLFQDSLQSLRDREHIGTNPKALWKIIGKKLHKFAKDDDITVFIIGHITKGGDFAGPMEIKHDVDVHAHMKLNPETMARVFELTKNRFGPAGIPYEFNLSAKGLDFSKGVMVEPDSDEGGSVSTERREKIGSLIKELLLKGERLSGYCFSRFPDPITGKMGVDCSGGYWRTMVEKIKSALEAEGHIMNEVKINGRTHVYVEI